MWPIIYYLYRFTHLRGDRVSVNFRSNTKAAITNTVTAPYELYDPLGNYRGVPRFVG